MIANNPSFSTAAGDGRSLSGSSSPLSHPTGPQSLVLAWIPRVDGVILADDSQKLIQEGKVACIPFVTGDCDDEEAVYSIPSPNVT